MFTLSNGIVFAQSSNNWLNLDTVKAGNFDTGKMWTFEFPPTEYFEEEYKFSPGDEWFDNVRLAALRFANYCSSSFVSADGLIMTNHHCARMTITQITREGEDLHRDGFIAGTLEDERPVPGLYVDQLELIEDVTDEIHDAVDEGKTDEERLEIEYKKIAEIEKRYAEETALDVSVTPLYFGGKYSVYGYKRYNDVRLVFAPEDQAGSFGGDPDNFTYPRYSLDCSFYRVYDEEGKPLQTINFLKWGKNGIKAGEAVFIVGNPATTNRLKTVAQLEYNRDISYPRTLEMIDGLIDSYNSIIENNPDRTTELQDRLFRFENSKKAYTGMLKGLRDPVLMQRKKDFENNFKSAIQSDNKLNELYGDLWNKIEKSRHELKKYSNERFAYSMNRFTTPSYFFIADELVSIAQELALPESERSELYVGEELENSINALMPDDFDYEMNNNMLNQKLEILRKYLSSNNELVKKMTGGKIGDEAVEYVLSRSSLTNLDDIKKLVEKGSDAILSGDDPFIYFVLNGVPKSEKLSVTMDAIAENEDSYNQLLGRALFEIYGTSIPPDATFTLRISDGVVKGFPYNGTIAPPITTFYGMYDRYNSFSKEYPWNLHERWLDPPAEFELSTPFNFVSTNDVTGGASGSPVINKNAEIVGVAFDGNIQGLPGNFIFRTEENRSVAVHSEGMMEAIRHIYKADRLADELNNGKMNN
jgi:hypothetical protein